MVLPNEVVERVVSYMRHQSKKSRDALVDLVAHSQQRLIDTVGAISEDDALKCPPIGAAGAEEWNLRQLMAHVVTAQAGVANVVSTLASGTPMPPTEQRIAGMARSYDGQPYSAIIDDLRTTNAAMLDAIRNMPAEPNTELTFGHPFFGPLNSVEWAVFQRVHDEDHIQHAQRIIATGV